MAEESEHAACVDAWLKRSAEGLSPKGLLRLFEAALGALWARTRTTLGEVTLTAITGRVLHDACEKFSLFCALEVAPTGGLKYERLRERVSSGKAADLLPGIRFVLVDFLTVLGHLTAEILTPELHAELSNVAPPRPSASPKGRRGIKRTPRTGAKRS